MYNELFVRIIKSTSTRARRPSQNSGKTVPTRASANEIKADLFALKYEQQYIRSWRKRAIPFEIRTAIHSFMEKTSNTIANRLRLTFPLFRVGKQRDRNETIYTFRNGFSENYDEKKETNKKQTIFPMSFHVKKKCFCL